MSDSLGSRQNLNTRAPSCCHSNKNDPAVATLSTVFFMIPVLLYIQVFPLQMLFVDDYWCLLRIHSDESLAQCEYSMFFFLGHMDKLSMPRSHWLHLPQWTHDPSPGYVFNCSNTAQRARRFDKHVILSKLFGDCELPAILLHQVARGKILVHLQNNIHYKVCFLAARPATIHFFHDTIHDTIHNNKTPHDLLVGSEVCTADKPSWKHACVCSVRHLEYDAKHCSAWIFSHQFVRKIAVHKDLKAEGGWALIEDRLHSHVCWCLCKCIVNIVIACSIYDIRIMAKNIAMYWYTGVSLQAKSADKQKKKKKKKKPTHSTDHLESLDSSDGDANVLQVRLFLCLCAPPLSRVRFAMKMWITTNFFKKLQC